MANESDFLFGLKFNFDPSGFLRGSAEAQDQLERTVAAIISAKDQTEQEVSALAAALSRSPEQVRAALKDLEKAERDHEREVERVHQARQRRQAEEERAELAQIRTRTQAVSQLRDALLSVAAITIGGAGLAGINSLLQATSARGVDEQSFAQRTGTNTKENIAEEEGAYLSGMSSREEARQSIGAYAGAQAQYRLTGESGLSTSLLRAGVSITPDQMLNMSHERFLSYVVGQLRGLGYNDQLTSTILEQSGLTSGGYTNLALHPDQMRRFNQQGETRANEIASNTQRDLEFQQSWRSMVNHLEIVRDDIAHDLEPWVKELDSLLVQFDRFSKAHPDQAREIETAIAAVVALGGLFSAVTLAVVPMMAAINALRAAASLAGVTAASPAAAALGGTLALGGAAAIAGKSVYDAYKEISYDRSDEGRVANNRTAMRDPYYGANRYSALEQNQKEYEVMSHLITDKGYTPEQAAAVAAMARGESGFNERAIGDNGTAEGAFQWHSDRRKAIEAHFRKRISQMSLTEQADAYDWELRNSEKAAGNTLLSARDLRTAVKGGLDAERPGEYQAHGVSGSEYARRYSMAQKALPIAQTLSQKAQPVTQGVPSVEQTAPQKSQPIPKNSNSAGAKEYTTQRNNNATPAPVYTKPEQRPATPAPVYTKPEQRPATPAPVYTKPEQRPATPAPVYTKPEQRPAAPAQDHRGKYPNLDAVIRSMRETRSTVTRNVSNTSHVTSNTNLNIQNVNVRADNAHQMVGSIKRAAGLPNAHAVAANTGVH